jgi:hypothetical protein
MIMTRKKICLLLVSILVVFALFFGSKYSLAQIDTMKAPATPTVPGPQTAVTLDQRFTEKVLATVPETYGEVNWKNIKILPDGRTFGYLARKGANYVVIYDGKEVTELDPDRQKNVFGGPGLLWKHEGGILFFGKRNGKCVIVLNDVVRETHCLESIASHAVSQNGEHFAYYNRDSKGNQVYSLYIDGKEYGPFNGAGKVALGNDGSFAFSERRGGMYPKGRLLLITGAGMETPYKNISGLQFAPDGKTLVYLASPEPGNKVLLFVGGTLKREYDGYSLSRRGSPALSSDGLSIAFTAEKNGQECVMVDDRCGEMFDQVSLAPRFLDGTHEVVYWAISGHVKYTVVGARKFLGEYRFVSDNGKTVARFWNDEKYETLYRNDGKVDVFVKGHVNVNGVERTVEGMVTDLALSPDGESLAYVVEYWGQDSGERRPHTAGYAVVRGDEIGERFPADHHPVTFGSSGAAWPSVISSLTFSPNGKVLAYVVNLGSRESGKWIVVVNGKKSEAFDGVLTRLFFSPDGSKLAFGALRGREILWKVIQE